MKIDSKACLVGIIGGFGLKPIGKARNYEVGVYT